MGQDLYGRENRQIWGFINHFCSFEEVATTLNTTWEQLLRAQIYIYQGDQLRQEK